MKRILLVLSSCATLALGLGGCDNSTSRGIVGSAYQALERGDFTAYSSTFTEEARASYGNQQWFSYLRQEFQIIGDGHLGQQTLVEQGAGYQVYRTEIIARSRVIGIGNNPDRNQPEYDAPGSGPNISSPPLGNPPQIYPSGNAHMYPDVISTATDESLMTPLFAIFTICHQDAQVQGCRIQRIEPLY
jgi:hypothetical protein